MKRDKLGRFLKGSKPTHGFKKGVHYSIATEFKKGQHPSPKTEFTKENVSREKNFNWKGGRYKIRNGYIWCYILGHPRAYRNGIYEHILVAEKKLGRYLKEGECVHHINGIRDDNRKKNIIVCQSNKEHLNNYHHKKRKL